MIEMANVAESSLRVKNVNEERVLRAVGHYVDSGQDIAPVKNVLWTFSQSHSTKPLHATLQTKS